MRIPLEALSARLVASRDVARGALQSVRLERFVGTARTIATDGKILATRTWEDKGADLGVNLSAAKWPRMPGVKEAQSQAKAAKADALTLDEGRLNGTAPLSWEGVSKGELAIETDGSLYPDTRAIVEDMERLEASGSVHVDLEKMIAALECLKAIAPAPAEKGAPMVARIEITDAAHVLRFKVGDVASVYLMPMILPKGGK